MKATEQYFPVVLFIMLYKVVLTCEFVDIILKCDRSNGSFLEVVFCGPVYFTITFGNFKFCPVLSLPSLESEKVKTGLHVRRESKHELRTSEAGRSNH